MSVTWKLALSYALRHPVRILLTSLAMIASACIVVWVVSGYDALVAQFDDQADEYLGRYHFFVVPEDPDNAFINEDIIADLSADPAVAEVIPVTQISMHKFIPPKISGEVSGRRGGPGGGPRPDGLRPGGPRPNGKPGVKGVDKTAQPPGKGAKRPSGSGRSRLRKSGPRPPMLVGTEAPTSPGPVAEGRWIYPQKDDQEAKVGSLVVTQATAQDWKVKLGDRVQVIFDEETQEKFPLKIVGILEQEASSAGMGRRMRPSSKARTGLAAGPASTPAYVATDWMKKHLPERAKTNLVSVRLASESKSQIMQFQQKWDTKITQATPQISMLGVDDIKSDIETGMMAQRSKQQAWAATGLSLLASLFIIFTTLSMGVTERVRQFAILQAVGLTRGQVARVIAIEGTILALIGWGGGLLAGWGLLAVVSQMQPGLFRSGASLGFWCIVFTGLSAFGGALAASILPAWRAMRVEPLEAMSPQRVAHPQKLWATVFGIIGLILIAVNPILVYVAATSMSSDALYGIYAAVGCSTMAIGFLLLAPATILMVESFIGPLLARLLGLEPRLLRWQLSSNLWRTLGTTAALTVGLGLFVAMQIWGYSMLEPFKPGRWVPDMLVAIQRGGFPEEEIESIRAIEGVRADKCIPLAVEQPKLASDITGSEEKMSVIAQDNVIMIGLDPQVAFGGSDPLVKARFVEGSPEEVIAKLNQGRNCVVPDHFLKATGLKLGDSFEMKPPNAPAQRVKYTIVGAVSLPGWHWMTKFSGLRRRSGRSAAIIFAGYDNVKHDFKLDQINFYFINVDEKVGAKYLGDVQKAEAAKQADMAKKLAQQPDSVTQRMLATSRGMEIDAKRAAVLKVGQALQPIAARHMGEEQPVNGQGKWPFSATMFGTSVRVSTPEQVQFNIMRRSSGMIWASCYLPLITLLVTSLGVVNTVMASVRARRWEFGVLRSQGITRSGLFRMILAEGILIGLITCLLSLGFGIFSGWCGTGISQYVSFFGGLAPPLLIPWSQLSIGFGIALGLCLLAAAWPAITTGRTEPLKLLQEGRAST